MSGETKKKSKVTYIILFILLLLVVFIMYSCSKSTEPDKVEPQNPVETPPAVTDFLPPEVVTAVAGNDFSMVITKNGELWSWGNGKDEVLGNGSAKNATKPVKVMEDVKSVSAGLSHVIAVKNDGSLWTWGSNEFGQLGYEKTEKDTMPKQVMTEVIAAAAGWNFSLALKSDGTVYSWGDIYKEKDFFATEPKLVPPAVIMQDVKKIAAGENFAVVIKNDDTLWVWGANQNGQLTEGVSDMEVTSGTYGSLKVQSKPIKILDNVQDVAVGSRHVLVLEKGGNVWTWGNDMKGQLGSNRDGETWIQPQPNDWVIYSGAPKMVLSDVASVAACKDNSAAIKKDGTLWTWGSNDLGQLGDGTTVDSAVPKQVGENIATVSVGYNHMFAFKTDKTLWSSGSNRYGQLGDGYISIIKKPVKVMEEVKQVSYSSGHVLAIKKDDTLWGWGENGSGELGDGTRLSSSVPKQIMSDVQEAAAGIYSSMALKKDGTVWTWGSNVFGQQGNGAQEDVRKSHEESDLPPSIKLNNVAMFESYFKTYMPAQVMNEVAGINMWGNTAYALKKDNSMWGWGWNEQGELYNDTKANTAVPVKMMDAVKQMTFNMAVKQDGKLTQWGARMKGLSTDKEFFHQEVAVEGNIQFVYGNYYNFAVTDDGKLWGWGEMLSPLVGAAMQDYTIPIQLGEGIRKAYNEGNNVYLIGNDDTLRVIHTSMFGDSIQLEGKKKPKNKLFKYGEEYIVMGDVQDIAFSTRNVFILKKDGTLWAVGSNEQGQIGDGNKYFTLRQINTTK